MLRKNYDCIIIPIISVILGIISGIIVFNITLVEIMTAVWIAFGLACGITLLLVYLITKAKRSDEACLDNYAYCLPIGIVGTIVTAIVALVITIVSASVVRAIVFGLGTAFFFTMLFSFIALIICLMKQTCRCME